MEYNADNIFAKIIRGELPCDKIYEDDTALAFFDIHPKAKIHALVISKTLVSDFSDFVNHSDNTELGNFLRAVQKTIELLGVEPDGYRVVFNKGTNGGQEVPHLHAHILGGEKLSSTL